MSDAHECPIEGCGAQVPRSKLMCGRHWRLVPEPLQGKLYRAYRALQRGDEGALGAHAQAMEDCIASVEGRDPMQLFA